MSFFGSDGGADAAALGIGLRKHAPLSRLTYRILRPSRPLYAVIPSSRPIYLVLRLVWYMPVSCYSSRPMCTSLMPCPPASPVSPAHAHNFLLFPPHTEAFTVLNIKLNLTAANNFFPPSEAVDTKPLIFFSSSARVCVCKRDKKKCNVV